LPTILVIEDSAAERAAIREALGSSELVYRIVEAENGVSGLQRLLAEPVDLVLCDLDLPGLDGEKLLRARARHPRAAATPLLILSAAGGVERRARLLQEGASDAIAKPFHRTDLLARLARQLEVKRLQDELREKNAALAKLSTVDALTGLSTRRYVQDVLSLEFLRARRYEHPLAILMVDVDRFKEVNDRHGHPCGDEVLRGVAERLLQLKRTTDTAGRYGGDELLVVMPHNTSRGAAVMAERWRRAVEATELPVGGGHVRVTLSIGIAEWRHGVASPEDLLAAADRALYSAKKTGRNRVEIDSG
jgi:diguanylate cyclase (GGDEF)-like protein